MKTPQNTGAKKHYIYSIFRVLCWSRRPCLVRASVSPPEILRRKRVYVEINKKNMKEMHEPKALYL